MNPLALEIWLYILIAYVLVSITIWIVARLVRGYTRIPDGYLLDKRRKGDKWRLPIRAQTFPG